MVIMAFMASDPHRIFQTREIAEHTFIAPPTVSKLLKTLTKSKLLLSHRGTTGGYQLALTPNEITVAQLIKVLEGPIALTECNLGHDHCPTQRSCAIRIPWLRINTVIISALESIKLSDLVKQTFIVGVGEKYGNLLKRA